MLLKRITGLKAKAITVVVVAFLLSSCSSSFLSQGSRLDVFNSGAEQYLLLSQELDVGQYPKTYESGELKTSGSGWWCSGFYPGTMIYLYERTKDEKLWRQIEVALKSLEGEQYNINTHDLGFMMYCSFGNAYRLKEVDAYKEVIKNSAYSLATRFNQNVGCIRSWDPASWNSKWEYPVIIDNMMNLEMLLWAGQEFNDSRLTDIAITHANTTMRNHFREDYSSYHVVSYDTLSGAVEMKNTDQGYADESAWSRGQAWGLYGFTVMYRFTKDEKYLTHAQGIADFILSHPNLPKDKIPYWDFNAPNIPDEHRDASAGAIIASALLELQSYVAEEKSKRYKMTSEIILKTLMSPEYTCKVGEKGGFILKHSVGNMPDETEIDVPLSYADYYYVEALSRYTSVK